MGHTPSRRSKHGLVKTTLLTKEKENNEHKMSGSKSQGIKTMAYRHQLEEEQPGRPQG
jgi:hypothetical protein